VSEPAAVAAYIRALLAGSPPDEAGQDWGKWRDTMTVLNTALSEGGPDAANAAWQAMCRRTPELARLLEDDTANDLAIARLASLSPIEYDRTREGEAEALGIRVSTLDRVVATARGDLSDTGAQGHAITFADDEETLWPAPVEGAHLLDAIAATYRRYLVLPRGGAEALALWTVHSHAHDVASVSPLIALQSPQKRCGKTTALQILASMVARALPCSNITPAAIFRTVERYRPTLILDEVDTYLRPEHDDLRGILNSGHTRATAYVIRTVGDDHEPRRFYTWCPKAIALIGALPSTLADRSITLHLQRKAPGETAERWRIDHADSLAELRRKAQRWAQDHREALAKTDPDVPNSLHDRAADNWRPLLAIADAAGGDWPKRARQAIQAIEAVDTDDDDLSGLLLRDLCNLFVEPKAERLTSAEICESLAGLNDRPWPTVCHGKPITPHRLARILAPYGIVPGTIRIGDKTSKGYTLESCQDTFDRYIPPLQTVTRAQGKTDAASGEKVNRNKPPNVTDSKSPQFRL
jgi:putative DNA primase/helicase